MAKVVEVELVAKTDGAVAGVNKVDQAVKKTAKTTKKASKELSGMQQIGGAVLGKLDQMTGGLASKLVAVGKAAKLSGKAMKTALISSGIGAAVVAVGLLVEHWDAIVDFVSDTNKELEKQIVLNNQNLDAVDLKLRNLKSKIELEKKQGKNVDSLIEKEKALIKEKRDTLLKSIEDEKSALRKLEIETETLTIAERIRQGKKGISEITEEENEALIKQRQILSDLENKYTEFESSLLEPVKEVVKKDTSAADAEAAEKARIEAIEKIRKGLIDTEAEERAEKLRLINEDYDEQIALAAKYYGTNSIKILQLKAAQKKAEDEQQAVFDEQDKAKQDKIDQEAIDKEKKRLEDIQKIVNDATELSDIQKLEKDKAAALAELDLLEATWIEKARITAYYEGLINDVNKKNADEKAEYDEKLDQSVLDAKLSMAANASSLLSDIVGKDSKAGKAFALASATISGIQGVQNAYTTAQESPITLGFPAYPVLQAALAGLVAAKNIQAIRSINPSGGGGSVPRPSGGGSQAPAFNIVGASGQTQLADAIGSQTQRPARAYVVSNDVTTAQELDRNIIEGASI